VDGDDTVRSACESLGARAVEREGLGLEELFVEMTSSGTEAA
jgi:hypothetical protein